MSQFLQKLKGFCCMSKPQDEKYKQSLQPLKKQQEIMLQEARKLLDQVEINLLTLIYKDLSVRWVKNILNLEGFILFVRLQGSWGRHLFEQFTKKQINDDKDLISLYHFLYGMAKIHKSTKQKKIQLLFKIFSQDENNQKGITFKKFVTMLCNYPTDQLKIILQDKSFIESQIQNSFVKTFPPEINNQHTAIDQQQQERQLNNAIEYIYINNFWVTHSITKSKSEEKNQQNQIIKHLADNRGQTHFVYESNNKKCNLRLNSIHMLVKEFASRVFKQFNIDRSLGRMSLTQFIQWSQKHSKLYQSFYHGLHSQIWSMHQDQKGKYGKYIQLPAQLQNQAIAVTKQIGQVAIVENVALCLIQQFIIVHQRGDKKKCINIIYLYGMAVEKMYLGKHGYGIQIKAINGLYPETSFFFKKLDIQQKWLNALRFYKGEAIEDHFQFKQIKGKGSYSKFFRGEQKKTRKSVGIKRINTSELSQQQLRIIAHQSVIISILDHPFLLKLYNRYQTKTQLYLVTEFIDGVNLQEYLKCKGGKLSQFQTAIIVKQIMIGLRYLHDLGIVHRDIKLQNIMVESPEEHYKDEGVLQNPVKIKIIDFGFANYIKELKRKDPAQLVCGSIGYIAPQILQLQGIDIKSDNFGVGIIMYKLLSGQFPFEGTTEKQFLIANKNAHYSLEGKQWTQKEEAKDLIKRLLMKDPVKRISLSEAIQHKWFQKATDGRKLNSINRINRNRPRQIIVA